MNPSTKRKPFIIMNASPLNISKSTTFVLILISYAIFSITTATQCPGRCNSCQGGVADCKERSLTAPPNAYPSETREINLERNHIRILGTRTFRRGQGTEVLKLSGNKIGVLRNDAFRSFPRLLSLDLTGNRITRIYTRGLAGIGSLRTLSLSRNKIRRVHNSLRGLTNLQQLNMAYNRINEIRKGDFSSLTTMRYLDLRGNNINRIHPEAFDQLTNLRYLFLNNNPIGSAVLNLQLDATSMQLLDMSNTQLTEVPSALPETVSELRLSNNQIMQINHTAFENVTNLQMLMLNENNLHFIGDGALSHLTELKEIWLRGNSLGYIPRDIPANVMGLHVDSNRIQEIEQGIFPDDSQLVQFSIANNNIRNLIPDNFAGLNNLQTINLERNQLQILTTRTFADLENLKTLKLSNNPLGRIEAEAFKNLPNLTQLSFTYLQPDTTELDGNFIEEMPSLEKLEAMASPGMGQALVDMISSSSFVAPSVEVIDLSYNNLQSIPQRLQTTFPNINKALLDGNPLHCTEQLQWLRDWMTSSQLQFHSYEEITCNDPISLRGRQIKTVTDREFREGGSNNGIDRSAPRQRARRTHGEVSKNEERKSKNQEVIPVLVEEEKTTPEKHLALREDRDKRRKLRRRNRNKNGKKGRGRKGRRRGKKNRRRNGKKRDRKNKKNKRIQG